MTEKGGEVEEAVVLVQRSFALNALRREAERGLGGALSRNVMEFARLLRRAGLPVGPAEMLAGAKALAAVDIGDKAQVRAALRAAMVHRHEHQEVFDQAFAMFWCDPERAGADRAMAMVSGPAEDPTRKATPASRRVTEAMLPKAARTPREEPQKKVEFDAVLTVSERERLQAMDFEAMSAEEIAQAKAEMRRLAMPLKLVRTRRRRANSRGPRISLRRTIRASLRRGGEVLELVRTRNVERTPPLVVLCDISGSMSRYAQILLHFLHAVSNDRDRVHVFLFGTRLTNITRQLRRRDPEVAFQLVAHIVPDWSGGTRIGEALSQFNRLWAKRVLGQGAVVLLITDGLDREGAKGLAENMDRLHRSCRRLIWLNPLLRWEGFEPKSQGIKAMLPHVDEFRPVHNLASLRELIEALSRPSEARPIAIGREAA